MIFSFLLSSAGTYPSSVCRSRILSPRRLGTFLLALILLPLSYVLGAFAATVIPAVPASADGNWGLSFQQEGKPPVANATADELKQYNAWYARSFRRKSHLPDLRRRIRERQHSLDPGRPEKASGSRRVFRCRELPGDQPGPRKAHDLRGTYCRKPYISPPGHVEDQRPGKLSKKSSQASKHSTQRSHGETMPEILPAAPGKIQQSE